MADPFIDPFIYMKHILSIIFLSLTFIASLVAQEREETLKLLKNPKPFLEAIRSDIKNRDLSWEGDKTLGNRIQGLAFAINQEIIHADSKDWANPSPERIAVIEKWGEILAPYVPELLNVAMEESKIRERSSTQARSILDFASPTEQFEQDVRQYMTELNPTTAGAAAYLLYEHRLITDADINILKKIIHATDKPETKPKALMSLSYYGATDGLEIAQEILRSEPTSTNSQQLVKQYADALEFLTNLGPKADALLPDLITLISKLGSSPLDEPKSGLIIKFQYARDVITGKEPMPMRIAKNGSGLITMKFGDSLAPKIQQERSSKDASLDRLKKSHSSGDSKSSVANEKETVIFPWVIITSFILLLGAVVTWLKLRKSKTTI